MPLPKSINRYDMNICDICTTGRHSIIKDTDWLGLILCRTDSISMSGRYFMILWFTVYHYSFLGPYLPMCFINITWFTSFSSCFLSNPMLYDMDPHVAPGRTVVQSFLVPTSPFLFSCNPGLAHAFWISPREARFFFRGGRGEGWTCFFRVKRWRTLCYMKLQLPYLGDWILIKTVCSFHVKPVVDSFLSHDRDVGFY